MSSKIRLNLSSDPILAGDDDIVVVPRGLPWVVIGGAQVVEMDLDDLNECADSLDGKTVQGMPVIVHRDQSRRPVAKRKW